MKMNITEGKRYDPHKRAQELIAEIKESVVSVGIPDYTQEDIDNVKPKAVIWNLFYGKYKFSGREFEEILKILFEK